MRVATRNIAAHRPFALVFSGGGARGLSHAGVLRALIGKGYVPSAIVGVSMGAVVGATYALNDNWFDELVGMDTAGFPSTPDFRVKGLRARIKSLRIALLAARDMYFGWGWSAHRNLGPQCPVGPDAGQEPGGWPHPGFRMRNRHVVWRTRCLQPGKRCGLRLCKRCTCRDIAAPRRWVACVDGRCLYRYCTD